MGKTQGNYVQYAGTYVVRGQLLATLCLSLLASYFPSIERRDGVKDSVYPVSVGNVT